MAAPVLQFKRGAFANLPGLRAGEPALTTDSFDLYVGIDSSVNNNKFFGSHRYWKKETTSTGSGINLVEGTSNGSDFITLKSPDSLSGITTYILPATPTDNYFLKTNSTGTLSWAQVVSDFTIAADTGTPDLVSTGSTITFVGGTNVNTAVTDQTITINLDSGISLTNVNASGIVTATTGNFTNLTGSLVGTISTATRANTVDTITAGDSAASYYITFVNSHNGSASAETVYTDDGIYYNPGTNTFTTQYAYFTGNITVDGSIIGTATTASRATTVDVTGTATNQNFNLAFTDGSGTSKIVNVDSELLYNPNTNILSVPQIIIGTGVGVTQFSSSVSTGSSTSSVPTSSAVINYVGTQLGNVDLTLGINADTGGPSTVNTSQTLTVSGTTNEVETSVSGQTITVGLPNSVTVTTALTTPTVNVTNVKANDGTTAITITNSTGAVTTNSDLTVGGNLYVNGSTTQVNTTALTVEDRTIDLGIVNGSAPSSSTTWDLGVLFNYYDGSAKKSAVVWEHSDARFKFASVLGADTNGTDNNTPQLTVTTFAPIEIGALWVNDCAGQSQVISCTDGIRNLENITLDAGTF